MRASSVKEPSEATIIRKKNRVSFASLMQRLALFRKSFFRDAIVRFTEVRPNAGTRADDLVDQAIIDRAAPNSLCKPDDVLTKNRRAFLEIEWMPLLSTLHRLIFQYPCCTRIAVSLVRTRVFGA